MILEPNVKEVWCLPKTTLYLIPLTYYLLPNTCYLIPLTYFDNSSIAFNAL